MSEETSQEELWDAFGKHGTVTDAFNPGRGFAFITYSTPDEAQKAIAALDGKEVCGREIQCNIAKPKENKGMEVVVAAEEGEVDVVVGAVAAKLVLASMLVREEGTRKLHSIKTYAVHV